MYTGGQMSTSLATGIVAAEVHAELRVIVNFAAAAGHRQCRTAAA